MPFPTRAVEERQDLPEVYQDNAQNILQKNSVSNLIGLLQQLNQISSYASEIFSDILDCTQKNNEKIVECSNRLKSMERLVEPVEHKFVEESPAYFYDNPYTGKEWQRRDALKGLLFKRDRCTVEVNRRRNIALPPPNLDALDHLSMNGKCINSFTDANFFMNEWLEAEKRKMAEEKKNRKEKKKKKRDKRKQKNTIAAVAKAKYDPVTGKKIDVKQQDIAVKQYTLSGDNDAIADAFQSNEADIDSKYNKRVSSLMNNNSSNNDNKPKVDQNNALTHASVASYANIPLNSQNAIQATAIAAQQKLKIIDENNNNNNDNNPPPVPPPFNPMQAQSSNAPPPIPPPFNPGGGQNNNHHSNYDEPGADDNDNININGSGPPPVPPPFQKPPEKKKLTGAEMAMLSAKQANEADMYAQIPPNPGKQLMPQKSALFLTDITKGMKLKKTEPVKRQIPKDKRSMLMTALRDKGTTLKHVAAEKVVKPKEKEVDGTIYEILNRRKVMNYESESSEDDSSWGSEEE